MYQYKFKLNETDVFKPFRKINVVFPHIHIFLGVIKVNIKVNVFISICWDLKKHENCNVQFKWLYMNMLTLKNSIKVAIWIVDVIVGGKQATHSFLFVRKFLIQYSSAVFVVFFIDKLDTKIVYKREKERKLMRSISESQLVSRAIDFAPAFDCSEKAQEIRFSIIQRKLYLQIVLCKLTIVCMRQLHYIETLNSFLITYIYI